MNDLGQMQGGMEDGMVTAAPEQRKDSGKRHGAEVYLRRRKLSRILAMQFLFQADMQGLWEPDWHGMADFRYLAENAYEDEDDYADMPLQADMEAAWEYADTLIKGAVECRGEIDGLVSKAASNWILRRMSYMDSALLRMASYEILKAPCGVTLAIAITEAVELAKKFGISESPRFINGVLDKVRRNLQAANEEAGSGSGEAQ